MLSITPGNLPTRCFDLGSTLCDYLQPPLVLAAAAVAAGEPAGPLVGERRVKQFGLKTLVAGWWCVIWLPHANPRGQPLGSLPSADHVELPLSHAVLVLASLLPAILAIPGFLVVVVVVVIVVVVVVVVVVTVVVSTRAGADAALTPAGRQRRARRLVVVVVVVVTVIVLRELRSRHLALARVHRARGVLRSLALPQRPVAERKWKLSKNAARACSLCSQERNCAASPLVNHNEGAGVGSLV